MLILGECDLPCSISDARDECSAEPGVDTTVGCADASIWTSDFAV